MSAELIRLLDQHLPQTQCGLCGHAAGCLPYATAMLTQHEPANKCVPGGQPVADQLADILGRPRQPVESSDWPIASDGRPQRVVAVIREDECIGCTKCLDACPVDAIIGSGKLMHTVIAADCTGCELCILPCPVDCIDLVPTDTVPSDAQQQDIANDLRQRYQHHVARYTQRAHDQQQKRAPVLSAKTNVLQGNLTISPVAQAVAVPAASISANLDPARMVQLSTLRSQLNKLQRQLTVYPNDTAKQAQLRDLQQQLNTLMGDA